MLTELVDPIPVPRSDLDSSYVEEPSKSWVAFLGWLLFCAVVSLPILWTFMDGVRADAAARRRSQEDLQEMKLLLAETHRQRAEAQRIRREVEELRGRGAR